MAGVSGVLLVDGDKLAINLGRHPALARRIARQGTYGILYEDSLLGHADPKLFDATTWVDAPVAPGYSGGRGATRFIERNGQQWVLRHFHRGGTIGRVLDDQFLWLGEARTRCFREWELLAILHGLDLPVPQPVGARYRRRGLTYTADLLTVCIPDVEPFSNRLRRGPVGAPIWNAVGRCIGAFHHAGVFHADLTAHNLQIDSVNRIFLLDFDRGRIRTDRGNWQSANLARLHRSLEKISQDSAIPFSPGEWRWLLDGYKKSTKKGTGP